MGIPGSWKTVANVENDYLVDRVAQKNFSYTGMANLDLWTGTSAPRAGEGIARYPRIRYRNVILQRQLWKVHPDLLPRRRPEQSDEDYFLSWSRWRRRNRLPRRVFATLGPLSSEGRKDAYRDELRPEDVSLLESMLASTLARWGYAASEDQPAP